MNQQDYLKDISEIRSMMERSSRFISLSGLSGILAGIFALIGAFAAYKYLNLGNYDSYYEVATSNSSQNIDPINFIVLDAVIVLTCSLVSALYLTSKKAKQKGQQIWDKSARRLILNLAIPLIAGGIFCIALLIHGVIALIAPATLIFYGLSLLNGSKYTLNDVRYLGLSELILGLLSSFFIGYGFLFWILGFGIFHIIYGLVMYYKYERN